MAVRIRLKRIGRLHRACFRICVMDSRAPRDGRVLEEVGTYDPMIPDRDQRCTIRAQRVDFWLGQGALPTERVKVLLTKYKGKVPEQRIDRPKRPMVELRLSAAPANAVSYGAGDETPSAVAQGSGTSAE